MATDETTEIHQIEWHNHRVHLQSSMNTLLQSKLFSDVMLETSCGRHLAAHRFVLAACSTYFSHYFQTCHSGDNINVPITVVLPTGIDYRTMKILLQYMYSGKATATKDEVKKVLKAGDILKISGWYKSNSDNKELETVQSSDEEELEEEEEEEEKDEEYTTIICHTCNKKFIFDRHQDPVRPLELIHDEITESHREERKDDDSSKLQCDICGYIYATPELWMRHNLTMHMEAQLSSINNSESPKSKQVHDNRKSCHICHKIFLHDSSMARHERMHTGDKLFHCSQCKKRI